MGRVKERTRLGERSKAPQRQASFGRKYNPDYDLTKTMKKNFLPCF